MGLTPPRLEAMDLVFVWCGSGPVLCSFAVFSAGESHLALDGKKILCWQTQIWPEDLRIVAVAVSFLVVLVFP